MYFRNIHILDIILRSYQLDGINWFVKCVENNHGGILSDEMGLGKTIQTISAILSLKKLKSFKKFLIISPLSVIDNWKTELSKYCPCINYQIYMGDKKSRYKMRRDDIWNSNESVILTTYEYILLDHCAFNRVKFDAIFMDEGHRIKNYESILFEIMMDMSCRFKFLLTGTPIQNNLDELYTVLQVVYQNNEILKDRKDFKLKMEKMLSTHNENKSFSRILDNWEPLKSLILRRTKAEVLPTLPDKKEIILFHSLTYIQKKMYKSFLLKDTKVLEKVLAYNSEKDVDYKKLINILMQIRKVVLHPYLFSGIEPEPFKLGDHLINVSHKMSVFDKLLKYLLKRNHKILVFSSMTRMLDIIQDYCFMQKFQYERLDGSVRSEERFSAINNFNKCQETKIFLLTTRAGGQGLNLTSADTVIFMDSDFNPQIDLQAMARIHRPGQTRPCRTIRLIGKNTVEEMIVYRAQQKLQLTREILGHEDRFDISEKSLTSLQEVLCFGLDKLFDESDYKENQNNSNNSQVTSVNITDEFLTSILGATDILGCWQEPSEKMDYSNDNINANLEHIYLFEGKDLKQDIKKQDHSKLLEVISQENQLRNSKMPRKSDTKKSVSCAKLKINRKEQLWLDNDYKTTRIDINEDMEDCQSSINTNQSVITSTSDGSDISLSINYVSGSVFEPVYNDNLASSSIICHLVDNSGSWGSGGLFNIIDSINSEVAVKYLTAYEMKDLNLGDVHLFPLTNNVELALLIGQKRDKNDKQSALSMNNIQKCFSTLSNYALKKKASINMPRIGYNLPSFNWYAIERNIKKFFIDKGIFTNIYYYSRNNKKSIDTSQKSIRSDEDTNIILSTNKRKISHQSSFDCPMKKKLSEEFFCDKFKDHIFWFHDSVSCNLKSQLKRNILALGGDVIDIEDPQVQTHVIYDTTDIKTHQFNNPHHNYTYIQLNLFQKFMDQ